MNKKVFVIVTAILVLISGFFIYKAKTDVYMQERYYTCKVISKIDNQYNTHSKSGTHYHRDFMLILNSEGKNFSLDVTPATWATHKEGDVIVFSLAPYQLDYYNSSPARWGLAALLISVLSAGVILIMLGTVFFNWDRLE